MQIREQGRQVQLIRSHYNPDKKRSEQTVAMHFRRSYAYDPTPGNYLTAEQLDSLSADELTQLKEWLGQRAEKASKQDQEWAVKSVTDRILMCIKGLENGVKMDQEKAAAAFAAAAQLQKILKKQGLVVPRNSNAERQARHREKAKAENLSLEI